MTTALHVPYPRSIVQLTYPEMKRHGKPSMPKTRKLVTVPHVAHDHKVGVTCGFTLREVVGVG